MQAPPTSTIAWLAPVVSLLVTIFAVMYGAAMLRATLNSVTEKLVELDKKSDEHESRLMRIETLCDERHLHHQSTRTASAGGTPG